jgi:Arc/MetJ-type ribon-helix-helix transcriptional regulator
MNTMSISLPPEQAEYIRRSVARDFGNASEFIRDCIRERMRREIEVDLAILDASSRGAAAGPSDADVERVIEVQREVRKASQRRRIQ